MVESAPVQEPSDCDLVAIALLDGERFRLLYERYADRLYWYAVTRTGSVNLADDVVNETMLAAFEQLDRFDSTRGTLASWLFGIARRKIVDQSRAYRRFWRFARRGAHRAELSFEEETLERIIVQDESGRVFRALKQLSERDQEIVALRYSAGLSGPETAAALGVSHAAARKRLSRALQRLEQALNEQRRR